ncbi:MAG: hypothetical protein ACOCXA_00525, partial [Planctomycetota bacterium]
MPASKNDIDHPVVYLVTLAMQGFMLLGVMPLLIWLCSSVFLGPKYFNWVLATEAEWNNRMFSFQFGLGDGDSFAFDKAVMISDQILPGLQDVDSPHRQAERRYGVERKEKKGMAAELGEQANRWLQEMVVPTQRYYLPLVMVRSLVLLGATIAFLLPVLAASYRGQAVRRRLISKGSLLKPHRFMIYKWLLMLCLSLLFAYPAYPFPVPAVAFFPVFGLLLHELGRKTSASMMEL